MLESLRGVCEITGTLSVHADDIEDLAPLEELVRVGGLVVCSLSLTSLDGLNALTDVRGGISLNRNPELANIDALGNVASVRHISITENPHALRLEAFARVTRLELLELIDLPWLEDLDGFQSLTRVDHLVLRDNEALASISGIDGVQSGNEVVIIGTAVTDVDALHAVTLVRNNITLADNPALTSLNGLRNLTSVRYLDILNNDALPNLDGLSRLDNVSSLNIGNNNALVNVDGLAALRVLDGGSLRISANLVLSSLRGLAALDSIARDFVVTYNPALPACEAEWLRDRVGIADIGGAVTIQGNTGVGTCLP